MLSLPCAGSMRAPSLDMDLVSPPAWKSPALDQPATLFSLADALATESPLASPPDHSLSYKPSLPIEIWDEIANQCLDVMPPKIATKTLRNLSLVSKGLCFPAQRALLRNLKLKEPAQIDRLVITLLKKPYLGQQTRSLEIKIAQPDSLAPNSTVAQRAQELSLLPLLALLPRVQHLKAVCMYDLPQSFVQLFATLMKSAKTFTMTSAFGYSRLVYLAQTTLAHLFYSWPGLTSVTLSMPWLTYDDIHPTKLMNVSSRVHTLEISGFRGSLPGLISVLRTVSSSLQHLVFDCPIDEEDFQDMLPTLSRSFSSGNLKELAIWSWTQQLDLPLGLLQTPGVARSLQKLTLSAQDATPECIRALPKTLQSVTIATHSEFAPLDQAELVKHLLASPALSSLQSVHLYNPMVHTLDEQESQDIDLAWQPILKRGIFVSMAADIQA